MAFHFACTRCGACCNRSPEVELGEAAALADRFVFRLMFRVYSHPETLATFLSGNPRSREQASAEFHQTKRQLSVHAVKRWTERGRSVTGVADWGLYLTISSLTLDLGQGRCSHLVDGSCELYDRRPLSCRTVPLHYSRPEAFARHEIEEFAARAGYRCDTSVNAPAVVVDGRISDPGILSDREAAAKFVNADRPWKTEILRRMKRGDMAGLPTLEQIRDNAERGALTSSMRIGWQIAADAGLMDAEVCTALVRRQLGVIDQMLAQPNLTPDNLETLIQMRREYAAA